jgi:hypothetical protein
MPPARVFPRGMPGPAVVILMLVVVALIVGATLVVGAPYLALPIVVLALVVWGGARVSTARGRREILDDRPEQVEFTEEDRRTLTPASATPPGRPGSEPAGSTRSRRGAPTAARSDI